jgi:hypothetical protein
VISSTFELELVFSHPTIGYFANIFNFQPDSEPAGDIFDICMDLIGAFELRSQDKLLAALAADVRLEAYLCRRREGGSPTAASYPKLYGLNGSTVDNTAMAVNIDLVPEEAPWQYGHSYFGGVPDNAMESNAFTAVWWQLLTDYAATLVLDAVSAVGGLGLTWVPVIWSKVLEAGRIISRWIAKTKPVALARRLRPYAG